MDEIAGRLSRSTLQAQSTVCKMIFRHNEIYDTIYDTNIGYNERIRRICDTCSLYIDVWQ